MSDDDLRLYNWRITDSNYQMAFLCVNFESEKYMLSNGTSNGYMILLCFAVGV